MFARTIAVLVLLCSVAQAQIYSPGAANLGGRGPICPGMGALCAPVPAAGYTGPIDIVASPTAWWGLRAGSSAKRGTKAANLCNSGDAACADVNSDVTTGTFPNTPTIGAITCGSGANQCTVKTLYDQSGNANDITNATEANRLRFTPSCIGSLPCMTGSGSSQWIGTANTNSTQAQPYTQVVAARRTSGTAEGHALGMSDSGGSNVAGIYFYPVSGDLSCRDPTDNFITGLAENTFHAIQNIGNGASGNCNVDGVTSTTDQGSGAAGLSFAFGAKNYTGNTAILGQALEAGFWPSAFSSGNLTSMNSNIKTFWGY